LQSDAKTKNINGLRATFSTIGCQYGYQFSRRLLFTLYRKLTGHCQQFAGSFFASLRNSRHTTEYRYHPEKENCSAGSSDKSLPFRQLPYIRRGDGKLY